MSKEKSLQYFFKGLAILKKKFLYLESLITYGTDINAKDRESKTALDYAEENRHLKEILERIGATSGTKNVPFSNRAQPSFLGNHQFTLFLTERQYDFHRKLQTGRLTPIPPTVSNNRHEAEEITSVPDQSQSIWTTQLPLSSSVHKKPKPSNKYLMTSLINALRKNNEKLFIIFLRQASLLDLQTLQEIKKDIQEPFLSYIHTRLKEFEPPIASLDV